MIRDITEKFEIQKLHFIDSMYGLKFNLKYVMVCKLYVLHIMNRGGVDQQTGKYWNKGTIIIYMLSKMPVVRVKTCAIISYYIFLFIYLPSSSDSFCCRSSLRFISFLASYFCNVCMWTDHKPCSKFQRVDYF